jgi:hypothetical protein
MFVRQLGPGSEEGQPTYITPDLRHAGSRSECPINAQGSGMRAYVLVALSGAAYRLCQHIIPRLIPWASS